MEADGHLPDIGRASQRPVVSPDGSFVAFVAPVGEIHIVSLASVCPGSRVVHRIQLPKGYKTFLSSANVLRWSPDTVVTSSFEDGRTSASAQPDMSMAWMLLSDGTRIIVLSSQLKSPRNGLMPHQTDESDLRDAQIMADYDTGNQYGKINYVDFLFGHLNALVLYEMNPHASIISLSKPQREDVPGTKFSRSQGFAKSPGGRYFALLTRTKAQDKVLVFAAKDDSFEMATSFAPQTTDAQGLQWSPNQDPLLAVWDTATYGFKVFFYTAMGHHLKQLDLHIPAPYGALFTDSDSLGVSSFVWQSYSTKTVLAAADGHKRVLVRRQEAGTMTIEMVVSFQHPDIIDGSRSYVWQESLQGDRSFTQIRTAFESREPDAAGGVELISMNADCSIIATKTIDHPKAVWIWQQGAEFCQLLAILVFRESVRQILWHPSLPNIMLVTTTQKSPIIYVWHDGAMAPAIGHVPMSSHGKPVSGFDGLWLTTQTNARHLFMLTSANALNVGHLESRDGFVLFESVLEGDVGPETGELNSMIETPSRSSRNLAKETK